MVLEWMRVCKPICEAHGIELMADFFMHERHVVLMNMFSWDQDDPEAQKRMGKLFYALMLKPRREATASIAHMSTTWVR